MAANTKHGRRSRYAVPLALASYEQLAADPDHLNLSDEITLARAVVDKYLANFEGAPSVSSPEADSLLAKLESVSRVVGVENKRRGTLSAAQAVVFLARVADIVRTALDRRITNTDERDAAIADVRHGLAGLTGARVD